MTKQKLQEKQLMKNFKIVRIIVKIFIILLCMINIFSFSNDNGIESTKKSDSIILNIYYTFNNKKLSSVEEQKIIDKYVTVVRKSAHMIIYFILGFTLCSLFFEFNITLKKILLFSILICFFYACSDEIHQSFISGRDGNFLDVIIDSIGYLFGIFLYFGGHLWIKRKRNS